MRPLLLILPVVILFVGREQAGAQAGDVQGEDQPPLPASLVVPPAPVRTPEDELATFRLPADLVIELVAAEPLVCDPVQAVFDARGRLWVVEMRGYMPDVDGRGEREANGSIAVLTDTDGDGRMDVRSTFLDGLVLPRSVAITRGGALVIAPPNLLFAVDEDGDGIADDVTVVDKGLDGITSPEYGINGLLPTLDNAFQCANAAWRYVHEGGQWKRQRTAGGGQWGITKDDWGRVYYDNNADPLRGDCLPSHQAARNPNAGTAWGVHRRVVDDLTVNPARVNPGVNRAYRKGTLDAEHKLDVVTGTCGPWIHRGDGLPEEYRGDAIVCEPCGNLLVRYELEEQVNGEVKGKPARNADGLDFLTSTDERFRPVNLCDGPDGALYVVDVYRGLIQHRMFVTTYLRKEVEARGLAQPIGLGRIWRIRARRAEGTALPKARDLTVLSSRELATELASSNGWARDTAQRLLVESPGLDRDARVELEKLLFERAHARSRVHALWVLAEKGAFDEKLALRVLHQFDDRVLAHAVRVTETAAALGSKDVLRRWLQLGALRPQVLLSLASVRDATALDAVEVLLGHDARNEAVRTAALASLDGRQVEFLERILDRWGALDPNGNQAGQREFLHALGRAMARERRLEDLDRAFTLLAVPLRDDADVAAVLAGMLDALPKDEQGQGQKLFLPRVPGGLQDLVHSSHEGTRAVAVELDLAFVWPGKRGAEAFQYRALTDDESRRFERGRELYALNCAACHQGSGQGDPSLAPALRDSPWVLGKESRLARILLHGLGGPIEVLGQRFDAEMPAFAASDEELAAILTYVRREWGNTAEPVTGAAVASIRIAEAGRKKAWTADELTKRAD